MAELFKRPLKNHDRVKIRYTLRSFERDIMDNKLGRFNIIYNTANMLLKAKQRNFQFILIND